MPLLANRLFAAIATGSARPSQSTRRTSHFSTSSIRSVKPGVRQARVRASNLRFDDSVRVVRGIREFRHGDAEQPVEASWLEMNSEIVDPSKHSQAGQSVRLRSHHRNARRGVGAINRDVGCSKGSKENVRSCFGRAGSGITSGTQSTRPVVMPYAHTKGRNAALAGAIVV